MTDAQRLLWGHLRWRLAQRGQAEDTARTAWLNGGGGYRVPRFRNSEVLTNIDGVQQAIRNGLVASQSRGR